MCLWTKQTKPLIAKKPIIAFKVLISTFDGKFISPYQEYDYTKYISSNEIVKDVIPKAIAPSKVDIFEALIGLKKVNEGIHLFMNSSDAFLMTRCFRGGTVFECEIPEGSHYFLDNNEYEICTNQFKFMNEL